MAFLCRLCEREYACWRRKRVELLAWDTCTGVEDLDGHGIAARIQVKVHAGCDFSGDEMALSGSCTAFDEDDHKSVSLRIVCEFHCLILSDDRRGHYGINIRASGYINNFPSRKS